MVFNHTSKRSESAFTPESQKNVSPCQLSSSIKARVGKQFITSDEHLESVLIRVKTSPEKIGTPEVKPFSLGFSQGSTREWWVFLRAGLCAPSPLGCIETPFKPVVLVVQKVYGK